MSRPSPRFRQFPLGSIYGARFLPAHAHPRNIPLRAHAHKWETVFLSMLRP